MVTALWRQYRQDLSKNFFFAMRDEGVVEERRMTV